MWDVSWFSKGTLRLNFTLSQFSVSHILSLGSFVPCNIHTVVSSVDSCVRAGLYVSPHNSGLMLLREERRGEFNTLCWGFSQSRPPDGHGGWRHWWRFLLSDRLTYQRSPRPGGEEPIDAVKCIRLQAEAPNMSEPRCWGCSTLALHLHT